MKDMERQKFEREWRDAFREAEVSPPENLWTNIELDLEKAEGGKMKRRLLYYKLTAAASIAFALCVAGVGTYFYSNQNELKGALAIDVTRSANATHPEEIVSQSSGPQSLVVEENDGETTSLENHKEGSSSVVQRVEKTSVNVSESRDKIVSPTSSNATNNTVSDTDPEKKKNRSLQRKFKGNNEQQIAKLEAKDEQRVVSNSEHINSIPPNLIKKNINTETSVVYSTVNRERQVDVVKDSKLPTSLPREGNLNSKALYDDSNSLVSFDKNKLTPLVAPVKAQLHLPKDEEIDPVMVMMAKLQQRELELMNEDVPKKKKDTNEKKNTVTHEKTWSTLGIAAGANNSAFNNGKDKDNTYSLGLALGTRVSSRWVVQGGLNYLRQVSFSEEIFAMSDGSSFRVASSSESAVKGKDNNPAALVDDNKPEGEKLVRLDAYDANKQAQFVSLPLQAGYLALSGKLSLLVNAGVSTDLFLRNTITPAVETGQTIFEKKTETIGGESDYDPVNFNGLFNTELSYKVGKYYRIALNPGLRYPFSSIYKSDTGITAQPLTLDIGMKIRYIFH